MITFLLTAAALYFLVVFPMNKLAERRKRGEEPPPAAPSEEVKLLTEIRDALVAGRAGAGAPRSDARHELASAGAARRTLSEQIIPDPAIVRTAVRYSAGMEQRKHWWNGKWGRAGRKDVYLRTTATGGTSSSARAARRRLPLLRVRQRGRRPGHGPRAARRP